MYFVLAVLCLLFTTLDKQTLNFSQLHTFYAQVTYRYFNRRTCLSPYTQRILLLPRRHRSPKQLILPLVRLLQKVIKLRLLKPRSARLLPRGRPRLRIRLGLVVGPTNICIPIASRTIPLVPYPLGFHRVGLIWVQQATTAAEEWSKTWFGRARYGHGVLLISRVFITAKRFQFLEEGPNVAWVVQGRPATTLCVRSTESFQKRNKTLLEVVLQKVQCRFNRILHKKTKY